VKPAKACSDQIEPPYNEPLLHLSRKRERCAERDRALVFQSAPETLYRVGLVRADVVPATGD